MTDERAPSGREQSAELARRAANQQGAATPSEQRAATDLLTDQRPAPGENPMPENDAAKIGQIAWLEAIADPAIRKFVADHQLSPDQLAAGYYRQAKTLSEVPVEEAGYRLEVPADFEWGDTEAQGRQLFKAAGLTQEQAKTIWDGFVQNNLAMRDQLVADWERQNEEALTTLKTTQGNQFDEFVARGKQAVAALQLSSEEVSNLEGVMGSAPMISLLAKLGAQQQEGGFVGGEMRKPEVMVPVDQMTPQQARAEIDRIYADEAQRKAVFSDRSDDQQVSAVQSRIAALYDHLAKGSTEVAPG